MQNSVFSRVTGYKTKEDDLGGCQQDACTMKEYDYDPDTADQTRPTVLGTNPVYSAIYLNNKVGVIRLASSHE